jgi:uncharacterized protein (DUF1684 family)
MESYLQTEQEWRQAMDAKLRAREGWLALAGLFWLAEGSHSLGSDPVCDLVLPAHAPGELGRIELRAGQVELHVTDREGVTVDGEPSTHATLAPDDSQHPSLVRAGELTMMIIARGDRIGLRVWDNTREARITFPGRRWYPLERDYRVPARFLPHPSPQTLLVPDILGGITEQPSPGRMMFSMQAGRQRLHALEASTGGLFLIFADATNHSTTYPGGRFLVTEEPKGDTLWIDFNRAYNPPCAFTRFATCPLPPDDNRLAIAIEAGERYGGGSGETQHD